MNIGRSRYRVLPLAAVAGALALAASGCGSSSGAATGTEPSAAASLLGPVNKATGTPVTLGFLTEGASPGVDNTPAQQTAQAAVQYVNDHLGGIAGHPIQLFVCESKATPAGAADCANQMVERKVPVVLNDITGEGAAAVPPILAAGIPYVTFSASSAPEMTSKGAYSITGAFLSLIGGVAEYDKQQHISKIAVIAIDVPAVTQGLQSIGQPTFQKAGVQMTMTAVPPGTPDVLPQVQSAISSGAQELFVFGDPTLCSAGLKAARNLGYTGKLGIEEQCINPSSAASVPDGYQGVVVSSVNNLTVGNPEYDLYRAVLQQYSPATAAANARSGIAVQGYGVVVAFARAMASVKGGDLTPSVVNTAMSEAVNIPLPVGGGATFSCNGTAAPTFPSLCSVQAQITTLDRNGSPTTYTPVDPTELFH